MSLKLLLCIAFVFASASAGCSSEKSKWIGSGQYKQLEGKDGRSREQNWEACGVKCTNNRACEFWEFQPTSGWCWNLKIYGKSSGQKNVPAVGKHITGRSGCPQKDLGSGSLDFKITNDLPVDVTHGEVIQTWVCTNNGFGRIAPGKSFSVGLGLCGINKVTAYYRGGECIPYTADSTEYRTFYVKLSAGTGHPGYCYVCREALCT